MATKKPANPSSALSSATVSAFIHENSNSPLDLSNWLNQKLPFIIGPSIQIFDPPACLPGALITIQGSRFSSVREENVVSVGGQPAYVVSASPTVLRVIAAQDIVSGPVKVTVGTLTASGPHDLLVLGYPQPGEDGPPIDFEGTGQGAQGDVSPLGNVRILVALVTPNDLVPTAAARNTVVAAWNKVISYYTQASYGRTNVQVDITTNWKSIDSAMAPLLKDNNIDPAQLGRVMAFSAQGAVDEGFNLDDYAMMASVIYLGGGFIRAWGGWSQQNFAYNNALPVGDPNRVAINLTANHAVNLIAIQETANWGRCAHEFGHNIVSAPNFSGDGSATLGEDVYDSDLVDPGAATAQLFELMGAHDTHPLFSGYHLEKLGYYNASNIREIVWDRNPFSQEFDIVAHGLSENVVAAQAHLLKIKIADGLHYYVQVRQRPGATAQIFDDSIPLAGAPNQGGVIVTSAIADVLQTNQQTRFITLLHPGNVLRADDSVEDPARGLRITVVNDNIQARPQICRVRVEWAQTVADDPNGSFDLRVEPWDSNWQTPDIWIDRAPFGVFDSPLDAQGRPKNNGDRPRPLEVNHYHTRIHVSGAMGASNVKVTFYSVFPPGVGDNGNWAPLASQNIPNIAQNGYADIFTNWTPVVGQHTCLKVYAGQQLGEISGGNNSAQENVFDFEAPANSPPQPVSVLSAIRNPLDERRLVRLAVTGVPRGYRVQLPHAWLWLDAKAEKHIELTVVPTLGYAEYRERKIPMVAPIRLSGWLARQYDEKLPPKNKPAGSRHYPIGGTLNRVHVVKGVEIKLELDRERQKEKLIGLTGSIVPAMANQTVRIRLDDPLGNPRLLLTQTDAAGQFSGAFDLSWAPTLEADRKRWKKAKEIVKGTYRAVASTVGNNEVSSVDSNIVFVVR